MKSYFRKLLAVSSVMCVLSTVEAKSQGTAFTYQGRLDASGNPVTGLYDLEFSLFNAATNGSQVGASVTNLAVGVTNGLFTTSIDFGSAFAGNALWLQIGVSPSGSGNFTLLGGLQPLTPVPYALYAETAGTTTGGSSSGWSLSGNSSVGGGFLGTTDNEPLYLRVNSVNGLTLYPSANNAPSLTVGPFAGETIGGQGIYVFGGQGGNYNTVYPNFSTIAGGFNNTIYDGSPESIIGGGQGNVISGGSSVIGGGFFNSVSGQGGAIPGGFNNVVSGSFGFAAGNSAQATNLGAFVWADASGGAFGSTSNNQFSVRALGGVRIVTGGAGMTIDGQSVGSGGGSAGGWSLTGNAGTATGTDFLGTTDFEPLELWVDGTRAFRVEPSLSGPPNVIGGDNLSSSESGTSAGTISGGSGNTVGGDYSTVGGGSYNTSSGQYNTVGGGTDNTATGGEAATVGGGYQNTASDVFTTVSGGIYNQATARDAFVGGGYENLASGKFSTVAGGVLGAASGLGSFVGGGGYDGTTEAGNTAAYPAATAVGGVGNGALAWYATVVGGYSNSASGSDAFVGGGTFNTASAFASVVPGGLDNVASGYYSFAAGDTAQAVNNGAFVWADASSGSPFSSTADNQFSVRALGGVRFVTGGAGVTIDGVPVTPGGGSGPSSPGWNLTGNAGTTPGADFLGTTDDEGLELHVYGSRGLRLDYASAGLGGFLFGGISSINVNGGYWGNSISNGVVGATIAGGGEELEEGINFYNYPNTVIGDFGTIGGGYNNFAGAYGTIAGGDNNTVSGEGSFAAGYENYVNGAGSCAIGYHNYAYGQNSVVLGSLASSAYNGCFVFNSSPTEIQYATGPGQFIVSVSDFVSLQTGGGNGLIARSDGDVGINTGYPSQALEVNGNYALVDGGDAYNGDGPIDAYIGGNGGGSDVQIGSMNGNITGIGFWNTANNAYMHIYCSSITIEGGADLAEPFPITKAEQPISEGEVVVIDEANPGQLKLTDQPYDTRVAGVVSGANGIHPGIQMQQQGLLEGGKNVALTGRVYVQADTSNGAIRPGDLLTTSTTPGRAMRVTDHSRAQGAILGKAMTALKSGRGMVLALVTLQ